MTVNEWIDKNTKLLHGKSIRIIDIATRKGVGDMMIFYMDKEIKSYKVTNKFLFIFI